MANLELFKPSHFQKNYLQLLIFPLINFVLIETKLAISIRTLD